MSDKLFHNITLISMRSVLAAGMASSVFLFSCSDRSDWEVPGDRPNSSPSEKRTTAGTYPEKSNGPVPDKDTSAKQKAPAQEQNR